MLIACPLSEQQLGLKSLRNKRLTGKTLEFALAVVGEDSDIGEKLKAGEVLTDYELHWVIDIELPHARLGSKKLSTCNDLGT
jgi:hypothetical protein